ncbi:cell division protein FtsQ/DivIB [Corynebacterium sp. 32222D000AT]|uniref:cell division protein FtsQ/DivIB n=1 Tax=unclassified Corynebacterium TaxID=2624378 RepID=UPI002A94C910|nr:FtsQ-type POTRA domain-containing protein [Mycobacteriaceae bacterium]MDY5830082.1 FtsQ-type POTRA domain-containing protein [Corynebacterium sp.]
MRGKLVLSVAGALVAVVAIAAAVVWFFPVFKAQDFELNGASQVTEEEVREASGIAEGSNLMRLDAHAAAEGVATLPWVKSATVGRSLPSTVQVDITEREAVAFLREGDGTHLIDSAGKEFVVAEPPEGAVEIDSNEEAGLVDAVEILAALSQDQRAQVEKLSMDEKYSATLHLASGRTVVWGANDDNADKARAFSTVLQMDGTHWNITNPELVTKRD